MKRQHRTITALSLPEEIIHEEILPRLPVKSLLRFRCISKSWCSLIRNKRFIKTHHQNSIKTPSFPRQRVILHSPHCWAKQCSLQSLLSEETIHPSLLEDPAIIRSSSFRVLGCYNGLVCIRKYPRRFYLWNPSTRIIKKLPNIGNRKCHVHNCGFGWDESSGEFKVFALVRDQWDSPSCKGRVYSSKTTSWKTIEYNLTGLPNCMEQPGRFVGGKLHWIENYDDIIFLDLKSEVFGMIRLPFDEGRLYNLQFGHIGGYLCLLCYKGGRARRDIRVWVMKEYGVKKSWERLMNLSLDHELLQRPFSTSFIHKDSNGNIFVFDGFTFLVYHPQDNVFCHPDESYRYSSHHVYVESLLSPEDV